MAYYPVDGDPDPKARGPQETPDKPESNTEVGRAAGWIERGVIRGGGGQRSQRECATPSAGWQCPPRCGPPRYSLAAPLRFLVIRGFEIW